MRSVPRARENAGYGSLWHGQRSHHGVAILAKGEQPAAIASVYLPNGNPQPGPKFDFKLAWFERFNARGPHQGRHLQRMALAA